MMLEWICEPLIGVGHGLLKVPEIAVILSVIALGRRLSNYGNPLLGYLLLGIGVIGGIWWIHSLYTDNRRQKVGRYRMD
jgi:hypothetical protein